MDTQRGRMDAVSFNQSIDVDERTDEGDIGAATVLAQSLNVIFNRNRWRLGSMKQRWFDRQLDKHISDFPSPCSVRFKITHLVAQFAKLS
jgi:hypothetical protein